MFAIDQEAQRILFRDARSASEFTDEPVTDEQLAAIYDLMRFAPTAWNQQPLRIFAVRSEDARKRMLSHLSERNRARAERAPLSLILAADHDFHRRFADTFPQAPVLEQLFAEDPERRARSARFNALIQIGYLILAVRAIGLAAGPMEGYDHSGLDADFLPDGNLGSLLVMNIGRGLPKRHERLPRLPADDVVHVL